ncbi:hypothetical protein GCM10010840_08840 [Deinococcus aerolatus]|uniref:Uncharacterized protein n=1 Tax=Deinococcus aerolatus TaxID=522487 RepID=A0ABQ2G379_9DEIO|nr:hypothetical protein [Deinococcus aerolatus]GGL73034.1 hypothetical protein GCM10010840_08840 [Deinococcus aerolatus]
MAIVMRANVVAAEDGGDPDTEADRGAEVLLGNANFGKAHRDYVAARALAALALALGNAVILAAAVAFDERPEVDGGLTCRNELSGDYERVSAYELVRFSLRWGVLDGDVLVEFDAAKAVGPGSIDTSYGYPVPDHRRVTVINMIENDALGRHTPDWDVTYEDEHVVALPTTAHDRARLLLCYRAGYALMVQQYFDCENPGLSDLDVTAGEETFIHFPELIEQHRRKFE